MTSSYNELSFPQPTSASVLSCVRSLTATFGSRLFASSLTDSSLFDCRALAQNGSYRKKNLHHYSEELTLQSEGNCGWFRTCCTFKETAPLRFLVYLTGALISGCFCTCPLNLSEWRFQPCTLLSNWKNVFFEWPHLPLSPHNRILLRNKVVRRHVEAGHRQRFSEELKNKRQERDRISRAHREGLCSLWPVSYTNTTLK